MVKASHQPPRNQEWFTWTDGSETVTEKGVSSHGFSFAAPHQKIKPPAIGRTARGLLPVATKFLALKENTASSGARLVLVNRYSKAAAGKLEESASPGSNGLQ